MPPVALCRICSYRLDPYWVEIGVDVHPSCEDLQCEHGEPRGARYCALCRRAAAASATPKPDVDRNVAPVGHTHPVTAIVAAQRALPGTGTKRRMVLDAIRTSGGLCDWELERLFGWKHESASACRRSLVQDGWLVDTGQTRPVPDTGNPAVVWGAV